jgi:hypothetical protein
MHINRDNGVLWGNYVTNNFLLKKSSLIVVIAIILMCKESNLFLDFFKIPHKSLKNHRKFNDLFGNYVTQKKNF